MSLDIRQIIMSKKNKKMNKKKKNFWNSNIFFPDFMLVASFEYLHYLKSDGQAQG